MFVVSLCCTSLYMIVADKIPYSIYSDGNFKRRHIGIQCVYFVVCKQEVFILKKFHTRSFIGIRPIWMGDMPRLWYIVQVKSMCVPILKSIASELTSCDAKNATSCVMGTATLLIDILTRNILKPTRSLYDFRFRSYGWHSGFRVFGDLDLDLCSFFCHTHCAWCTGISMRSFIRIRPVWMGDMLRLKFW